MSNNWKLERNKRKTINTDKDENQT